MKLSVRPNQSLLIPAILLPLIMFPFSFHGTKWFSTSSVQTDPVVSNTSHFDDVNKSFQNGIAQITTPNLTIRITGNQQIPHFHFWPTNHTATTYHAKFMYLAEYNDKNNDGAFQHNETKGPNLFAFPSAAPSWEFSGFYNITQGNTRMGVGFNFSMSGGSRKPIYSELAINITNRFFFQDTTTTLNGVNENAVFNVSGLAALKTNIRVSNWDFEKDTNQLALRWDISQAGQHTQARLGNSPINIGEKMKQGSEQPLPPEKNKQATLSFNSSTFSNTYFTVLTVVKAGNTLEPSHLSYRTDGSNLRFFMSAPATDGTIVYDPIFGTSTTLPEDSTAPVLTITAPSDTTLLNTREVTVEWDGNDAESGVASYAIKLDGGEWYPVGLNTSFTFTDLSEGKHIVSLKAVDNADNPTVKTFSFTIKFIDVTQLAVPSIFSAVLFTAVITASVFYILKRNGAF